MPSVSGPPVEEATELFERLGYEVSDDGSEFVARRKWRTVRVTVLDADEASSARRALADGGRPCDDAALRCYVTWKGHTGALRERLESLDPECDWAVLGVESAEEYEVAAG